MIGSIVLYRLPDEVVLAGDGSYARERLRPATVVRVIGKTAILHVFLDPAVDKDVSAAPTRSATEGRGIGEWRDAVLTTAHRETLADVEAEVSKGAP